MVVAVVVVGTAVSSSQPAVPEPLCGKAVGRSAAPRNVRSIVVANLNVLHGNTERPPKYPAQSTLDRRLEIAARQIAGAGVDVIGMEEVADTKPKAGGKTQPGNVAQRFAKRLSALTKQTWYWCWYLANPHFPGEPDVQTGGGGPISDQLAMLAYPDLYASFKEGEAVLSRYPIEEADAMRLPPRTPLEHVLCVPDVPDCNLETIFDSKVALQAKIDTPGGLTQIVTTHLSSGITDASDLSALQQAAAALAFSDFEAAEEPPARLFFTCDCNVQPTDQAPLVQYAESMGWKNVFTVPCTSANVAGCTAGPDIIVTAVPRRRMFERLDYVFWRAGSCAAAPKSSRLFENQPVRVAKGWLWPSDHLGVLTTVPVSGCG